MKSSENLQSKKTTAVLAFGIAMSFFEAAVVVYLRRIYGITDLTTSLASFDLPIWRIELGRELATLVMLYTFAWTAGRNRQSRFGFFVFVFGVWDIFYYVWLKILLGWPETWLDTDLLFLVPLPWWGPVIAPILLALLMSLFGLGLVIGEVQGQRRKFHWPEGIAMVAGVLLCLYTFMADGLAGSSSSPLSLVYHQPGPFQWTSYLSGLCLLIFAVWRIVRKQT